MKKFFVLVCFAFGLMACSANVINETCPAGTPNASGSTSNSSSSSGAGGGMPTYVCDANPAIEVEMQGAVDMSTSIVVGGPVTEVLIINHCDVIVNRLRFGIEGADTNQYVVGTAGTHYFTNLRVTNSMNATVMGPAELPKTLVAGSVDSGPMVFTDEFSLMKSEGAKFNLDASFSQTEDAPGEFKHGDKLYFVYWNDGKRPFEPGDIAYADGTDVPLDRIKAPSLGLYTYVNMAQKLP